VSAGIPVLTTENNGNRQTGFTVIELLVVVAIIAVVAALLLLLPIA
jgi:prepilin-type N-terminal cleavage/methylation domain-containing protein